MAKAERSDKTRPELSKRRIGKMPSKTSINLVTVGQKQVNYGVVVPLVIILALAIALFSKFLVIDRLADVARAENKVTSIQASLDAGYAELASYGDLNETYAHYTYSGFTEEELTRTSRVDVLELIRNKVLPDAQLNSWALKGNELTLVISGNSLQEINLLAQTLQDDDLVNYCTVNTANTTDALLKEGSAETVSARILVYLNPKSE